MGIYRAAGRLVTGELAKAQPASRVRRREASQALDGAPGGTGRRGEPGPLVAVWDVQARQAREVPPGEAAAGLVRYARTELGIGTPACGVAEGQAVELLREHGMWPP